MSIPRPEYPAALETWWLKTAREKLSVAINSYAMTVLEGEVAKLSDAFTIERSAGFGDYGANEKLLLAYGLFFFPQTYVRTLFQFDEILRRCDWKAPAGRPVRMVDLGAGTGSAGLAVASRLAKKQQVELTAVENSAASLAMAEAVAGDNSALWPKLKFLPRRADLREFSGKDYDIILACFSINEAFHDKDDATYDAWIDSLVGRLADGGLLLISEPAIKITSERLERFRNRIAAAGKQTILAPCLHQQPCPMLAAGGENFCHEVRWWKPTSSLQSLNRHLFRTIQFLKSSFIAIANTPTPLTVSSPELMRLVSPMMDLKGRVQCDGCAADGAIRRYEMLTRKLETADKHAFLKTERGDIVRWENLSLLGDKQTHRAEIASRAFGFD